MQFFEQTLQDLQKSSSTLDYDKLKKELIASGKFTASEAHYAIEYAIASKILEKIGFDENIGYDMHGLAEELFTGEEGE